MGLIQWKGFSVDHSSEDCLFNHYIMWKSSMGYTFWPKLQHKIINQIPFKELEEEGKKRRNHEYTWQVSALSGI